MTTLEQIRQKILQLDRWYGDNNDYPASEGFGWFLNRDQVLAILDEVEKAPETPGEIDRVWVLQYVDYDDSAVVGVYTTELAADTAKFDLQRRNADDLKRNHGRFFIDEMELDPDLKDKYWWEPGYYDSI